MRIPPMPMCSFRKLLASKEGQAALALLDEAQQVPLATFAAKNPSESAAVAPAAVPEASDALQKPELLAAGGRSFEQWVCSFADALAQHAW